ncbi:alpha/beta hydrolase [Spirosoma spitsbergense]|uniref:alpha/beta hydrolase n=1 Tax=Spirosoma spitsbergense TaxID=431554 RepID=UPI00037FB567|nr:alpha/beta hydrolase [Spirosoma spitsbergense]
MLRFNQLALSALTVLFLAVSSWNSAQGQSAGLKNVVLVHGAYADGFSWSKVIPMLDAQGFNIIAVELPLTSLKDDAMATKRAIARMEGPVLLVGHSWAGMVITEAGNDPKVAGLLYISALIPNDGQAVVDVVKGYPDSPGGAETREDASGFLYLSKKGMNEDFVPDLSLIERLNVYTTQGPWAKKALSDKVSEAAWKTRPSWVIIDKQDRMVNVNLQQDQAKRIKATTLELNSGHVSILSHPKEVATFIIDAARKLPTQVSKR